MSTTDSDRIAQGLSRIGVALRHEAWEHGVERALTPTQGQILATLAGAPRGRLPAGEIARRLAITAPTVSESIAALERKGLVTRRRADHDARSVECMLTPRGRREGRRAAEWPDFLAEAAAELSDYERAVFLRGVVKMIRSLQVRGRIPVQRMCVTCTHFRPNAHPGRDQPHHCAFVDAPLGDASLRIDCPDHDAADDLTAERAWSLFILGNPIPERSSSS